MADTLGANMLDPRVGNDKRKALLQMLMQRAQGGSSVLGNNSASGGPVMPGGTSFLGGMRAIPHNRSGMNDTGFTQGSQVASQFLGGMGVGARQAPQSSPGQIMAQFLGGPAGGGASGGDHPAPQPLGVSPAGAPASGPAPVPAPAPAGPMAPLGPGPVVVPGMSEGTAQTTGAPTPATLSPSFIGQATNPYMPTSGQTSANPLPNVAPTSGLISLGGGAYYNPATGAMHYVGQGGGTTMRAT